MGATATPQGFLLPVLGILLVTSEWTPAHRAGDLHAGARRGRVLLAKVLAALIAGAAAIVLAMALVAALATLVGGAAQRLGAASAPTTSAKFGLLQVIGVLQGLAFGLLFLNSAAAIVTYFVLPTRSASWRRSGRPCRTPRPGSTSARRSSPSSGHEPER